MAIVFIGIDLAKKVFALHGVDETGRAALVHRNSRREQLLDVLAKLAVCTIGMQACSGAYHRVRQFQRLGHTVRLIAPKFVLSHRKGGKRGRNDTVDVPRAPA